METYQGRKAPSLGPINWGAVKFPAYLVAVMTLIQLAASMGLAGHSIDWANIPRSAEGIPGILLSHLRHNGWGHLFANSIPLLVLPAISGMLMPRYTRAAWWIIPPLAGVLLWILGRGVGHVGASALVYAWFFFLLAMMVFHRSWLAIIAALIALGLFGGLVWVFSGGENVSWDGHATGAAAGVVCAWMLSRAQRSQKNFTIGDKNGI